MLRGVCVEGHVWGSCRRACGLTDIVASGLVPTGMCVEGHVC